MNRVFRRTADIAKEDIWGAGEDKPGYINELCTLLANEPTLEQLVEAEAVARLLLTTVSTWRSATRIITAAPHEVCPVITRAEIDGALRSVS